LKDLEKQKEIKMNDINTTNKENTNKKITDWIMFSSLNKNEKDRLNTVRRRRKLFGQTKSKLVKNLSLTGQKVS
jgi:DNA-binding TFAR19-related protein (PDSD5 family)